jgi:hypothetical protein
MSDCGKGPWSEVACQTYTTPPGRVIVLTFIQKGCALYFNWMAAQANGAPITKYQI